MKAYELMNKTTLQHISTLILAALIPLGVNTQAQQNQAWALPTEQDYAKTSTLWSTPQATQEDTYFACYGNSLLSRRMGQPDEEYRHLEKMLNTLPTHPLNEAVVWRLTKLQETSPLARKRYPDTLTQWEKHLLLSSASSEYLITVVREYLLQMYQSLGDKNKCREYSAHSGNLVQWDFVLGPFENEGLDIDSINIPKRLSEPHPEKEINLSTYPGWIKQVHRQPLTPGGYDGWIYPEMDVYPSGGTLYLGTRVNSASDKNILLALDTPDLAKLWLNGKPIAYKSINFLYTGDFEAVPVTLKKGTNYLVLKLVNVSSNMEYRVRLLDKNYTPLEIQQPSDIGKSCTIKYPELEPGSSIQSPLFLNPGLNEYISNTSFLCEGNLLAGRLLACEYLGHSGQFERVISPLNQLIKENPSWYLPNEIMGSLCQERVNQFNRSSARLLNQAQSYYTRTLELDPVSCPAIEGLFQLFLNKKQWDNATEYLHQMEKHHPTNWQVPAMHSILTWDQGWPNESESWLAKTTTANPAFSYAWQKLADYKEQRGLYSEAEPLRRYLYGFQKDNREVLNSLRNNLERQGKQRESSQMYEQFLSGQPLYFMDWIARGHYQMKLDHPQEALNCFSQATLTAPHQPGGYIALGDNLLWSGDTQKAITVFQQGLNCRPSDPELTERVRRLTGTPAFYEPFDMSLESVSTTGFDAANYPRASVIYLLDLMAVEYQSDGGTRTMTHQAIKILNEQGQEAYEEVTIPASAQVIMARTITPDGKIYQPTQVTQTGSGKTLSMYAVGKNTIIEYLYTESKPARRFSNQGFDNGLFFFQQTEDPMALSRLSLSLPSGLPFHYRNIPETFQPIIKKEGDRIVYTWTRESSIGIKQEPMMPAKQEILTNVLWSTWPNESAALQSLIDDISLRTFVTPEIKTQAHLLAEDSSSPLKTAQTVYSWILDKIATSSSSGGMITDTLLLKNGNTSDKTLLALALLRELGVKADLVLADNNPPSIQDATIPQQGTYDSFLLRVLIPNNNPVYLDFGSKYRPFGQLGDTLQGKPAIVCTQSGQEYISLPDIRFTQPDLVHHIILQPEKDGNCQVQGEILYQGDIATYIREIIEDPVRKKRIADEELNRLIPGFTLSTSQWTDVRELSSPLRLVFEGTSSQLLLKGEKGWTLQPLSLPLNMSRMVPSPTREQDYEIKGSVLHRDFNVRLVLPEGMQLIENPSQMTSLSPFGSYQLEWKNQANEWILKRTVLVPDLRIKPSDYGKFVDFCQKIDNVEKLPFQLIAEE